jgi:outer membrane murein-binding lipoprotein Lpp
MAQKTLRKLLLSLSVTAVLTCSWSGSVFADGDKVEALEARVAELEALVHQLLQKQDATNEALEAVAAESVVMDAVEVATEAKVIEMMEEHQQAEAEKVHKHSYKLRQG